MKNIHAFVAALALAATTTATAIIEERWGDEGWGGHDGNETTSYVTSYTTFTTDIYTTYCPSPTKVTIGTKTYTITTSETLTVTDCPCTVTKPVKPTTSASGMPTKPANTTSCPTQTKSSNSTITPTVPVISSSAGLNTSIVHITSLFVTTVPPGSTAVVVSGTTFPVTKPGEVTIPIVTASPLPPTQTPNQPQVSPTAPLQIENNGVQNGASLGAFVAGLVALLL